MVTKKIYKLTLVNHKNFYVTAEDATTAEANLLKYLEYADLFFTKERVVKHIDIIALLAEDEFVSVTNIYREL